MGGVQRRKGRQSKNKSISKKYRTRVRTKDLDQVQADLLAAPKQLQPDLDLPGLGLWPCVPCSIHCCSQEALAKHGCSKNHKKRMRLLLELPYTQAEADAAAGMGNALVRQRKPPLQAAGQMQQ